MNMHTRRIIYTCHTLSYFRSTRVGQRNIYTSVITHNIIYASVITHNIICRRNNTIATGPTSMALVYSSVGAIAVPVENLYPRSYIATGTAIAPNSQTANGAGLFIGGSYSCTCRKSIPA